VILNAAIIGDPSNPESIPADLWTQDCSNEPNGTQPEWQIVDAHHVLLRVERLGAGKGRTYTVTTTCADPSGNQGSHRVIVVVPHNQ